MAQRSEGEAGLAGATERRCPREFGVGLDQRASEGDEDSVISARGSKKKRKAWLRTEAADTHEYESCQLNDMEKWTWTGTGGGAERRGPKEHCPANNNCEHPLVVLVLCVSGTCRAFVVPAESFHSHLDHIDNSNGLHFDLDLCDESHTCSVGISGQRRDKPLPAKAVAAFGLGRGSVGTTDPR